MNPYLDNTYSFISIIKGKQLTPRQVWWLPYVPLEAEQMLLPRFGWVMYISDDECADWLKRETLHIVHIYMYRCLRARECSFICVDMHKYGTHYDRLRERVDVICDCILENESGNDREMIWADVKKWQCSQLLANWSGCAICGQCYRSISIRLLWKSLPMNFRALCSASQF